MKSSVAATRLHAALHDLEAADGVGHPLGAPGCQGGIGPEAAVGRARRVLPLEHQGGALDFARSGLDLDEPPLEQLFLEPEAVSALDLRGELTVPIVARRGEAEPDRLSGEQADERGPRLRGGPGEIRAIAALPVVARGTGNPNTGEAHRAAILELQPLA